MPLAAGTGAEYTLSRGATATQRSRAHPLLPVSQGRYRKRPARPHRRLRIAAPASVSVGWTDTRSASRSRVRSRLQNEESLNVPTSSRAAHPARRPAPACGRLGSKGPKGRASVAQDQQARHGASQPRSAIETDPTRRDRHGGRIVAHGTDVFVTARKPTRRSRRFDPSDACLRLAGLRGASNHQTHTSCDRFHLTNDHCH